MMGSAPAKVARSPGGRFARKGTRKSAAQWRERNEDFVAVGCCATCATRLSYELDYEPGNEKRVRTGTRHWSPRARRVRRAHRHPHGVIPVYRTSLASPIRPIRLPLDQPLEHHRVHDLGLLGVTRAAQAPPRPAHATGRPRVAPPIAPLHPDQPSFSPLIRATAASTRPHGVCEPRSQPTLETQRSRLMCPDYEPVRAA